MARDDKSGSGLNQPGDDRTVVPGSVATTVQPGDDRGGTNGQHGADDVAPIHSGLVRFFDAKSGGHFFTSSQAEQNALVASRPDLKQEGVGFLTDDANAAGATGVYRFFNTHDGGHFFTASAGERDDLLRSRPDLVFEGVAFHEHMDPSAGYVPVYRFFDRNDGGHLFTSSPAERDTLVTTRHDLVAEGIAFYAPKT